MNPDEVRKSLSAIEDCVDDPEVAHGMEDELYRDILRAICSGTCEDPQQCAHLALTTQDMKFPRWCA